MGTIQTVTQHFNDKLRLSQKILNVGAKVVPPGGFHSFHFSLIPSIGSVDGGCHLRNQLHSVLVGLVKCRS